jgi:hypothetical protein
VNEVAYWHKCEVADLLSSSQFDPEPIFGRC